MVESRLQLRAAHVLEGHTDRVWSVSWSPSGNLLASCSGDKTVRIWAKDATSTWVTKTILEESHIGTIRSCEWSPDGKYLATASFDKTIAVWEHVGGEFECLASLEGHENEVKSAAWSPSGALLASGGRDKSVWVWEMESGADFECISVLNDHTQDVKMVRWHPSRELLVSASYDDTIKVSAPEPDGEDWHCVQTLGASGSGHTSTVWGIAFDAAGDRMVSCSDDKTLIIWDSSTDPSLPVDQGGGLWKPLCSVSGCHERTIYSVDWSWPNDLIASGAGDDCIRIFRQVPPTQGSEVAFEMLAEEKKAHSTDVNAVRWHPKDPRILASAGDDETVKIWEIQGELPVSTPLGKG